MPRLVHPGVEDSLLLRYVIWFQGLCGKGFGYPIDLDDKSLVVQTS